MPTPSGWHCAGWASWSWSSARPPAGGSPASSSSDGCCGKPSSKTVYRRPRISLPLSVQVSLPLVGSHSLPLAVQVSLPLRFRSPSPLRGGSGRGSRLRNGRHHMLDLRVLLERIHREVFAVAALLVAAVRHLADQGD